MEPKNITPIETHTQSVELDKALSIVELEERFELTAAAAEADRCTITGVEIL
jgi:hypothetical protein